MWASGRAMAEEHAADQAEAHRVRMRANFLAAVLVAVLLVIGAWLADELGEASLACYPPDGGCEATGVPFPAPDFPAMMPQL